MVKDMVNHQISKYWRQLPLAYMIVEELEKRGGSAKDSELYTEISNRIPVTPSDFLKALMVLEMQGIIYVESLGKDLRSVQLRKAP